MHTVPFIQRALVPRHLIPRRVIRHFLVASPRRVNPSLHVTVQVSPLVAPPSSPSEQSIVPFTGAISVEHTRPNSNICMKHHLMLYSPVHIHTHHIVTVSVKIIQ